MTFQQASEGAVKPPRPDPACPKCLGAGTYPDPPLAQQEREAREGRRRWACKVPCDCYAPHDPDPHHHYDVVINGQPCNF